MKSFMQKFAKSLLLPISTIAAAGVFLGLAAALQNSAIVGEAFASMEGVQNFIGFIRKLSGLVFGNLPVFFAISIALGMAKEEKATAAFSSLIGFLVFHLTLNYLLKLDGLTAATTSLEYLMENQGLSQVDASIINAKYGTVLGYFTYRMNVFAGIIVGLVVTYFHNKFYKIQLPSSINFYGGKRFVPLVTLVGIPVVAFISYYAWPIVDSIISTLGKGIENAGAFGPYLYGSLNRLLIPTGLHHILNQVVRFTPIGGTAVIDGETVVGALNIFNSAIGSVAGVSNDIVSIGSRYVGQGHMISVMFGLPAAGLAMIHCAKDKNRKKVKALIAAGIASSILTGITEPLEFTFMFISPILFGFHIIMYGLGFMIMDVLGVAVGGVQAGLIDFTVFGLFRGIDTKWYLVLVIGAIMAVVYYFGFRFIIEKFNVMTPGREDEEEDEEPITEAVKDDKLSELIVNALGGKDNILSVENCMTRLRVVVANPKLINEKALKDTGASGFVRPTKDNIQIVYGLKVDQIATDVKSYLKNI
ncbi:PTS transporter subunit EIIC [Maledivibacter halophilus]|uniref:PTS system, maltose and glucose-specific IIC component n=1 Tax=Maledivibacter halophilus TaxID=36842 RepID=A0A1T5KPI6_9FIRM|nr:PTS transporter subunit EIIC [Maledivibacter halophilus]SKC65405.1 PTS system, maltose and glucose-specific IIC component [Maledivibacter halophilus]